MSNKTNCTTCLDSVNASNATSHVEVADNVTTSAEPVATEGTSLNATSENATEESLAPAASTNATEAADSTNVSSEAAAIEGAAESVTASAEPVATEGTSLNATSDNATAELQVPAESVNASQQTSLNNSVTITVIEDGADIIAANESNETSQIDTTAALDTSAEAGPVQEASTDVPGESGCTTCAEGAASLVTVEVLDEAEDNATMNKSAETQEDNLTSGVEAEVLEGSVSCYLILDTSSEATGTVSAVESPGNDTLLGDATANSMATCINCAEPTDESVIIRGQDYPTCAINASSSVCAGSAGNVASVLYQIGATYQWTITNGVITSSDNSPQIVWTAGNTGAPVVLSVTVTKTFGNGSSTAVCACTNSISIQVTENNGCSIVAPANACAGSRNNTASVPSQTGARYVWNVTNGMITSGQFTNQIAWTAGDAGTAKISISVERALGYGGKVCVCNGSFDVQVRPNPVCEITAPLDVCKGSVGNKASVPDAGQGAEYVWMISNGAITAGQGTREITWNAGQTISPITINVNVKTSYNCTCAQ